SGVGKALATWAGYPNMHDLTETGAHPVRWLELLQSWKLKTFAWLFRRWPQTCTSRQHDNYSVVLL
ncbi:MAG: hypothetical protein ACKPKO_49675, partial [Candidatus Fonsibacter sp.]